MDSSGRPRFDTDYRGAQGLGYPILNIPCGHCLGCNIATARSWSVRCFHESLCHSTNFIDPDTKVMTEIPNSCMVTLTYDPENLPADQCLDHSHFQLFMKRLRKSKGHKKPIRYFMCGEYGGKTSRPHFHALLFNHQFDDTYKTVDFKTNKTFIHSHTLDKTWGKGRATVDAFTFGGAAYVAGYVAKKSTVDRLTGPLEDQIDLTTGEVKITAKAPEYRKMSTHPGIGAAWITNPINMHRVYSTDSISISAWTFHPPKYYDVLLERYRPDLVAEVKAGRALGSSQHAEAWDADRCASAETIAMADLHARMDIL